MSLTAGQGFALLPPALRGAAAASSAPMPCVAPSAMCTRPSTGNSEEMTKEIYKHIRKVDYNRLVSCADKNLVIPLEAKTWPRHVLEAFIDSGGALRPASCSVPDQRFLENLDMKSDNVKEALTKAAEWLLTADAVLVGSGAGMGVDSGLPTFRGKSSGVWTGLDKLGLAYEEICEPHWFKDDPRLAWGFWRFCHAAYKKAKPHAGYKVVHNWASSAPFGAFSFTSNIDGHWEASGWDPEHIVEVHGAVRWLQCSVPCCQEVWQAPRDLGLREDSVTHRVEGKLPLCSRCSAVARPAVQMFGADKGFSKESRSTQAARYDAWLKGLSSRPDAQRLRLVCLELGCGLTVPTVRRELESAVQRFPGARLIRVNPEQPGMSKELAAKGASLPMPAGTAIRQLEEEMKRWWGSPEPTPTAQRFLCIVWDKDHGGAEVEVPLGATVEQILRLLRRQPDVDLELGPSREISAKALHLIVPGLEEPLGLQEPVPATKIADIGEPFEAAVIAIRGVRFLRGRSSALDRRMAWANAVLDDLLEAFGSEEFQTQKRAAELTDRKGIASLVRSTHAKVLPGHGLEMPPKGVLVMSARIGVAYHGCEDVAAKVDRSLVLSGMKR